MQLQRAWVPAAVQVVARRYLDMCSSCSSRLEQDLSNRAMDMLQFLTTPTVRKYVGVSNWSKPSKLEQLDWSRRKTVPCRELQHHGGRIEWFRKLSWRRCG